MGFWDDWIEKVMNCVTSATFLALINRYQTEPIMTERGLQQGCPLSPYLFLIYSEDLLCLIKDVEMKRKIHGLKISRFAPTISHLLFADDYLIFTHANQKRLIILSSY